MRYVLRRAALLSVLFATGDAVLADDGRLAIALLERSVVEFRALDGTILSTVETEPGPRAMARLGESLFVANRGLGEIAGSTLSEIDTLQMKIKRTISICDRCAPRDIAFDARGTIWISSQAHRAVYWSVPPYDEPSGSVLVSWGWPAEIAALGSGRHLAVGFRDGSEVALLDTESSRSTRLDSHRSPAFIRARPAHDEAWVASELRIAVERIVPTADEAWYTTETIGAFGPLADLQFLPAGDRLIVARYETTSVDLLDAADGSIQASLSVGSNPGALALSPDGKRVALHVPEIGEVVVIRIQPDSLSRESSFKLDGTAAAIVWLP